MSAPDRTSISAQRRWVLTALVAVQLWASLSSLPLHASGRNFVVEASVLCAVLAMFFLRSIPIRWIVRGLALFSGLVLARFGELEVMGGTGDSWRVLIWLGACAVALVAAPSGRAVPGIEPGVALGAQDVPDGVGATRTGSAGSRGTGPGTGARTGRGRHAIGPGRLPLGLGVAAAALVLAGSLLLGPAVGNAFPLGSTVGDAIDLAGVDRNSALIARDTLDMTTRPRLSDEVVMTVRSELVSFWRTELYDTWDGSTWSRSRPRDGQPIFDGQIVPSPEDVAAVRGTPSRQEFRIEVGIATAMPTAPSPVAVDSPFRFAQRGDGTLLPIQRGASRGTSYSVQSRQMRVDSDQLRRASRSGRADPAVLERYASPPVATPRVVELAEQVTEGKDNDYDRVVALEEWMDENAEYSLDAPLSPKGVDVVDHFLFETRLGWCEQIASSLVVMARAVGVPARLAVGFAPGEWDSVGGRFVVRERDAHAWAEVWLPEAGWVAFDPTADVPRAGEAEATAGAAASDWRERLGLALLVVGIVAVAGPALGGRVVAVLRRLRARRARRRRVRGRWDVVEEHRIEQLGSTAGRRRLPGETITAYSAAVAEIVDAPDIGETAARIERFRYGP